MADKKEQNTLHAQTSFIPIHTPPDVRIGLTILPARYLLRGSVKTLTDSMTPDWLRRHTSKPIVDHFSKSFYGDINAVLAKADPTELFGGHVPRNVDEISSKLESSEKGKQLIKDIDKVLDVWGAGKQRDNTLQYAFKEGLEKYGKPTLTELSKSRLRGPINDRIFEMSYDLGLGVGSTYMSYELMKRAMKDIRSIYTETVAYETGKDPKDVSFSDIMNSDNQIIQSTAKIFKQKQFQRFGASALFFTKSPFKWLQSGEIAIGAWGLNWMFDIWGRQPTMLESFTYFVNDKLNPMYGIGDPISKGDVINLYQQYAQKFNKDIVFKSVLQPDLNESRTWAEGERIFNRIADLMNETYNYKHPTELDDNNMPIAKADFTLPKFIYLLGHGLINPREPEWTMTFIEVANSEYGMEGVRAIEKAKKEGALPTDVLETYPVNIYPYRDRNLNVGEQEYRGRKESETLDAQEKNEPHQTPQATVSADELKREERIHAAHEQHVHDLTGL